MSGGSGLSLEDLIEFRWAVAIGDDELTLAELEQLAKQKAPLVRLRGKWVQVNADDIRAAIELLQKKPAKLTHVVPRLLPEVPSEGSKRAASRRSRRPARSASRGGRSGGLPF